MGWMCLLGLHMQVMLLLQMPIWDHLEELRERVLLGALAAGVAVLTCFAFSKELVVFLEAPVASQGVRFLQLSPGEFFFTTLKVTTFFCLVIPNPCHVSREGIVAPST